MGAERADAFDADTRAVLDQLCADGILQRVADRLQLSVETTVTWGHPLAT
jgi:hypothetical protein